MITEKIVGRFRIHDAVGIVGRVPGEGELMAKWGQLQAAIDSEEDEHETRPRKPGEAFGITRTGNDASATPINRFQAASDARNGIRRPTQDELARMTPAQRFTAWSNFRNSNGG